MQTIVPAPSTPPKANPIVAKTPSTRSLIIPNFFFVLSEITTATRSKMLHAFMIKERGEKMKVSMNVNLCLDKQFLCSTKPAIVL